MKFIKSFNLFEGKTDFPIKDKIDKLVKTGNVSISVFGARVSDELKARFVLPLFESLTSKETWKFIKDTTSLDVKCTDRSVTGYDVFYTGTITNSKNETVHFEKVNNGLAVTMG